MNRADRRRRSERGPKEPRAKPGPDLRNIVLREMRFDTPDASDMFLKLRYLDDAWKGSREDGIRLPPIHESVSATASSGGMVYKAFPHGLMYGDQMSLMAGGGLFLAVIMIFLSSMHHLILGGSLFAGFLEVVTTGGPVYVIMGIILFVLMLIFLPFALLMVAGDLIGFRFNSSALFDRNAGKVHLFSDQSMPWAPWRYHLKSYDWRCVRGEIDTVSIFSGTLNRKEAGLRCVVMDRPGGDTVIDQFVLGINMPAQHIQPLLDTWEHVRRFMQREGPLFADQNDKPNPSLGRQPLWKHLLDWPALLVRATIDMFKMGWKDKDLFAGFGGVLLIHCIPVLWFPMLYGFLPWLSGLAKRNPIWPAEIIASVGGAALSGKDLEAWRAVVPEKGQQILDVDHCKLGPNRP
jgi:hypothetical protein